MDNENGGNFRGRLARMIFEADTPLGKIFDVVLLILIAFSVLAVMLDSVRAFASQYVAPCFICWSGFLLWPSPWSILSGSTVLAGPWAM